MERFNEVILWSKNINFDTFVTLLTSLLIFLVFKLFSGVLAYVIITLFKLNKDKEKNKNAFRKNGIYIALNLFFSILGLYLALMYLKLPENINVIINKIFKILIIAIVSHGLARCITKKSAIFKFFDDKTGKTQDETFISFIIKVIRGIIYVIATFMIISELGYNLNGLLTGLGLSGVVVALAAQDAAKNIFGGIVILWDKPFKIGDWIETPTFEGIVEEITFRSTRIRNFENSIVTIPNSTISNEALINWSKMKKRRYKQDFVIELSTPLKKVCDVQSKITTMLENHPRVLKEGIVVKFDKLTDSGYNILVRVFTDALSYTDFLNTSENINLKIMDIIQKEKVELAYNSQTIYLKK